MVSVFVYSSNPNDFPNWRWKVGNDIQVIADREGNRELGLYERRSPIPSIVLPPDHRVVSLFRDSLPSHADEKITDEHVEGMRKFITGLRDLIGNCENLSTFKLQPLCVFIHFGGEQYTTMTNRLARVWKKLAPKDKESFLCFAITRRGNGINEAWKRPDGILFLPSTENEVLEVLQEGCRGLGEPYLEYYKYFENTENTTPKPTDESTCQAANAAPISRPSDVLVLADDNPLDGKPAKNSPFTFWNDKVNDKGKKWEGVDVKTYDEVLGPKGDASKMSAYVFVVLDHAGDIDFESIRKLPPRTLRVDGFKYQARLISLVGKNIKRAENANEFKLGVYRVWLKYLEKCRGEEPKNEVLKSIVLFMLKVIVLLELGGGFALSCWKCWRAQSLKSELGFGFLEIAFLVVTVGVLLASREEKQPDR